MFLFILFLLNFLFHSHDETTSSCYLQSLPQVCSNNHQETWRLEIWFTSWGCVIEILVGKLIWWLTLAVNTLTCNLGQDQSGLQILAKKCIINVHQYSEPKHRIIILILAETHKTSHYMLIFTNSAQEILLSTLYSLSHAFISCLW